MSTPRHDRRRPLGHFALNFAVALLAVVVVMAIWPGGQMDLGAAVAIAVATAAALTLVRSSE